MPHTLAHRLGVEAGDRLLILNAPERYLGLLEPPEDVKMDLGPMEGAVYDGIHLFALDRATVEREVPPLLELAGRARLWLCYPERGGTIITDLSRDRGWDALDEAGWGSVAHVPIDSDWSALRFRPEAEAASAPGRPRRTR